MSLEARLLAVGSMDSRDRVAFSLWVGGREPRDVDFLRPFVGPEWEHAAL